jgi:tryptophanyl-tRNA synthetase
MPRLAHIPTYKEKSVKVKEVPLGLYLYPVLQAADVLLYRSVFYVSQRMILHYFLLVLNTRLPFAEF